MLGRIQRIEEKFNTAVKTDGEELAWPDLVTEVIELLLDADGKSIYGGRRREYRRASVSFGEQTAYYDRRDGESYEQFKARALASTPCGRFARRFEPIQIEADTGCDQLKASDDGLGNISRPFL